MVSRGVVGGAEDSLVVGVMGHSCGVRESCEARGGQVHIRANGVSRRLIVAKAATAWSCGHWGSGALKSPLVMSMGGSAVRAGGQSGAEAGVNSLTYSGDSSLCGPSAIYASKPCDSGRGIRGRYEDRPSAIGRGRRGRFIGIPCGRGRGHHGRFRDDSSDIGRGHQGRFREVSSAERHGYETQ